MPYNDHYVIIGNGPAGNNAAGSLRRNDRQARITIISDEFVPFYYKPRLTGFIEGRIDKKNLMAASLESYRKQDIRLRLGQKVERVDPATHTLFLHHMEKIKYTGLVIASGSRARLLPCLAPFAAHMHFLSSYTDVMEYKNLIRSSKEFFIFGGDLVGFQFLKTLVSMGRNVSIMIHPDAFWPHELTGEMMDTIFTSLSRLPVHIIINDTIAKIDKPAGKPYRIVTRRGLEKDADMIMACNGLIPNIEFLKGSGLELDRGVIVDEYLKTGIDDIYACGSCAQVYNPSLKAYSTTIGWPNASVQGEIAAMNLLCDHRIIDSAPRKYFDLQGIRIKTTWWEDIDEKY